MSRNVNTSDDALSSDWKPGEESQHSSTRDNLEAHIETFNLEWVGPTDADGDKGGQSQSTAPPTSHTGQAKKSAKSVAAKKKKVVAQSGNKKVAQSMEW